MSNPTSHMNSNTTDRSNPTWWNDKHDSTWERTKDAMKRDWEQTKADMSKTKGHELNQNASDTVKQAAGKEVIPPGNQPNRASDKVRNWKDAEPAVRFGAGARYYYAKDSEWNDDLDGRLGAEWMRFNPSRPWSVERDDVRHGWQRASILRGS